MHTFTFIHVISVHMNICNLLNVFLYLLFSSHNQQQPKAVKANRLKKQSTKTIDKTQAQNISSQKQNGQVSLDLWGDTGLFSVLVATVCLENSEAMPHGYEN